MRLRSPAMCVCVCLMCWCAVIRADDPIRSQGVIVRVYNAAGASSRALGAARDVAGGILRDAGVQVGWRDCGPAVPIPDVCQTVVEPIEVVVRIIPAGPATSNPQAAYGESVIDTATGSGTLATVFYDRVALAADRSRVLSGTVLGRVIAHEIGHLLLGTTLHSDGGIMRARWPDHLLASRIERQLWRFSEDQARTMRGTLLARASERIEHLALHRAEP